ncbi:MAG TPA: GH116 family glycosyl-hydrolase [Candidatus Bathyarchaeia archaeon]
MGSKRVKRYSKDKLHRVGPPRVYGREASEAAFLLGGIGTGNFSVGARGDLRDWEIFNRPAKGQKLPYSFFALAVNQGGRVTARALESRLTPPFSESHGFHPGSAAGLPRFRDSRMWAEYPFAYVELLDEGLPVRVLLEAYTPFIPHEPDDSGLPLAVLTYTVQNVGDEELEVTVAGSLLNAVGFTGVGDFGWVKPEDFGGNVNTYVEERGLKGLKFTGSKHGAKSLLHGSMVLATLEKDVTVKPYWYRSGWWDNLREFWDDLSGDGRLTDLGYDAPSEDGKTDVGSLGVVKTIGPGESVDFTFLVSWYFPNRLKNWDQRLAECGCKECGEPARNKYAARFTDAWDVCRYYVEHRERLEGLSCRFRDALYGSTLPVHVLDAVASNITVIRSSTCFWLEDGTFLAYEGCFDDAGCCSGNCTHVWNYEQTLGHLFPSLARNMRETEFRVETGGDGKMSFRAYNAFPGTRSWDSVDAASDGQCGSVMRLYREWKLSGDTGWANGLWPKARLALDYACRTWDPDGDGVTEAKQHNTYDISFYGPNPLSGALFLGALKAGVHLAETAGDYEAAERYRTLFEKGRVNLDKATWERDYYVQRLDDVDAYKYQHGVGCLSDQLLGQLNASLMGLGYLLPPPHVRKAIRSVYGHNFMRDFTDHDNTQRTYVLNDEAGLLLCTWPRGGRPAYPFVYSHEVWTGVEYHVASHLILEGYVDEGLTLAKAVRDRQDGVRRNPWDEVECGHHYARSLSSWGLLLALSGFSCDAVEKRIEFKPRIDADGFSCFWSTGAAWGTYSQTLDRETGRALWSVDVIHGSLDGYTVNGRRLKPGK